MKIAIVTMFNGLSSTYSLVNVVKEQLKMLLEDNIQVKIFVSEHCPDQERTGVFLDKRIEWVKIVNSNKGKLFHWRNYTKDTDKIHKSFFKEAEWIAKDYVRHLEDTDICILHDILYQGIHLVHNVAIREAQKQLPHIKFIAFMHSAPVPHQEVSYPISCMYTPMENTTFVYPTTCGLEAVARQYQISKTHCVCINNSIDVTTGMGEETKHIVKQMNIVKKDILFVYPARLTMAKKFHVITTFAGILKTYCSKEVGIIFCDFSSMDIDPETYKFMIKDFGIKNGLAKEDMLFTSECGYLDGVSRKTVFELFSLSNLFLCPSFSESFGLTVMEAASRGNYIILNEAVPALEEIGKEINAYFMRWDAKNFDHDTYETYHPTERLYYINHAKIVLEEMERNPVVRAKTLARTRYTNEWIYENQLKPLLIKLKEDNPNKKSDI